MTPKQNFIYQVLLSLQDSDGTATVNIHTDLRFPMTPDSINPALSDLQVLKTLEKITDFERQSSRVVKVSGIK